MRSPWFSALRAAGTLWVLGMFTSSAWAQPDALLDLFPVRGAGTKWDEVVLGADADQLVFEVFSSPWAPGSEDGETRIATWEGSPWNVLKPKVWGRVPQRSESWSALGRIVHLDIDPSADRAVLTADDGKRLSIWMSYRDGEGEWGEPWPVPALDGFDGDAAYATFDGQAGREGDVLVALRPDVKGGNMQPASGRGRWKGGFDLARIRRAGGYRQWMLLDALNAAGDEVSLVSAPGEGGWISANRLGGEGGLDPWWCAQLPLGAEWPVTATFDRLEGHTLQVLCGTEPIKGLSWEVQMDSGFPVRRLKSDAQGRVNLGMLVSGNRYSFHLLGRPPEFCPQAVAEWRDGRGELLRQFRLEGTKWSLSLLAALPLPGWPSPRGDRSRLPKVNDRPPPHHAADWILFHDLGAVGIQKGDRDHIRALARQLMYRPEDRVLVIGHASSDGRPEDNVQLALERARFVAAQLEFAGLSSAQIRFEGKGDRLPLMECPPGVHCPAGDLERSRRTELHIQINGRADGGFMQ